MGWFLCVQVIDSRPIKPVLENMKYLCHGNNFKSLIKLAQFNKTIDR